MKDNILQQEPLVSPDEKTPSSKAETLESLETADSLKSEPDSEEPTPRTIPPDPLQLCESDEPIL